MTGPLPSGVLFITVTDRAFFPGTVACINSIFYHHPDANIVVVNHEARGLKPNQIRILEAGGARVLDSGQFAAPGRYIGPWELKAYAAFDLAREQDMIIGIDSDCMLCSGVGDIVDRAFESGKFTGGKDGFGVEYDDSYTVYGIQPGSYNSCYMSTSLYFCRTTPANVAILERWAQCTNEAIYNKQGPYPGHGDQGLLNSILYVTNGAEGVDLLENATWSQHFRYWDDVIVHEQGEFRNLSCGGERQRSFHVGGTEKFWSPEYRDRVKTDRPSHAIIYAWWLYMFWCGRCKDPSINLADCLPAAFLHLRDDFVEFLPLIRNFDERDGF